METERHRQRKRRGRKSQKEKGGGLCVFDKRRVRERERWKGNTGKERKKGTTIVN